MKLLLKTLDQIKEEFKWEPVFDGIYVYHKQEDISSYFPHTVLSRNRYYIDIDMYNFFGKEIDVEEVKNSIYHYEINNYGWNWKFHKDWFRNYYIQDFLTDKDFE